MAGEARAREGCTMVAEGQTRKAGPSEQRAMKQPDGAARTGTPK